jgi:hypothetical protein
MKEEAKKLIYFLDGTGLSNNAIAKKVGVSGMAISYVRNGRFPSQNIDKFFAAFPELSPTELFGHYSDGSYIELTAPVTELELKKQVELLQREVKDLRFSNNHLKLSLSSRLSKEEKEIINFNGRNQRSMVRRIRVNKNMEKATLSVTQGALTAL